jgi:hypothetical protein
MHDIGLESVKNWGDLPGRLRKPQDAHGRLDATCQGQVSKINVGDKVTVVCGWQVARVSHGEYFCGVPLNF